MASLLEQLLNPISDASFCGDDGSYDGQFEAAKAEAEKISGNDWEVMEAASKRFLTETSKDMRILGFMALSTGMMRGVTALAEVAEAYALLTVQHWPDIHPQRPNARVNAFKWLVGERVLALLSGLSPVGDYEKLQSAYTALSALQNFIYEKMPDGPGIVNFIKLFGTWAEKNKPVEAPPPPEPGSAPSPTENQAGPLSLATEEDALMTLQQVAGFFSQQDGQNPLSWRLMRLARWSVLRELPPNQGGKTMVPAPYPDTLAAFRNMNAAGNWKDLAENGENSFSADGMLFWFDLQRYLCNALQNLGEGYPACAEALQQEMALLLKRLPGLEALTFEDGTPFADSETRDWLDQISASLGGGTSPGRKKKSEVGAEIEEAEKLFAQERFPDALGILKAGLQNDSSAKNNFDRKLRMADLCLRAGKPIVAKAIGEELLATVDKLGIEAWDPEICLNLYRTLRLASLAVADSGDEIASLGAKQQSLALLGRIARLDPLAAVQSEIL